MKYKIFSYPIDSSTPIYGNAPLPSIKPYSQIIKGDRSNSCIISVYNHTGTHIDAPRHFVDTGRYISEYLLDELIFRHPVIVNCPKEGTVLITPDDLRKTAHLFQISDCLLLHTGYGVFRGEEKYRTDNPGIAPETILWIRREYPNIRCIGIDSISISSSQHREAGRAAHKAAFIERSGFGKPLLLIEDMKLSLMPDEKLEMIIVVPWQIARLDSAPCSVIAIIK